MSRWLLREQNPKLQAPNPKKVPNPKHQTPDHEHFRNVSDRGLGFGTSTAGAIFNQAREFLFPAELIPVSITPPPPKKTRQRSACKRLAAGGLLNRNPDPGCDAEPEDNDGETAIADFLFPIVPQARDQGGSVKDSGRSCAELVSDSEEVDAGADRSDNHQHGRKNGRDCDVNRVECVEQIAKEVAHGELGI
jgi:hypothetical protein